MFKLRREPTENSFPELQQKVLAPAVFSADVTHLSAGEPC